MHRLRKNACVILFSYNLNAFHTLRETIRIDKLTKFELLVFRKGQLDISC